MSDLPFSLVVNVRRLPKKGERFKTAADAATKEHLLSNFDLEDVSALEFEAEVKPWKRNGVEITGSVTGDLVQPCAITGKPISSKMDEQFRVLFVPEGSKLALPQLDELGEIVLDMDGDDIPETFTGDSIDLAEVWLEFFALGFDPFAKADDAELPQDDDLTKENDAKDSPFAVLADYKNR